MSTDSSELTFVRCPSCRSLVPALSTRCRMCGTVLDSNLAADANADELEGVPEEKVADSSAEDVGSKDPLSDFFYDDEDDDQDDDDLDFADDADDDISDDEELELSASQDSEEEQDAETLKELEELDSLLEELNNEDFDDDDDTEELEKLFAEAEEASEKQTKKAVKSVKKSSAKKTVAEPAKQVKPKLEKQTEDPEEDEDSVVKEDLEQDVPEPKEKVMKEKTKKAVVKQVSGGQDLYGWLVSAESDFNDSEELRTGKFFITQQSLKENDFVIDDESISTPHALININLSSGFQIQDLMSDQGVYLKKSKKDKYEQIEDIAVVESGDYIKFGDIEYRVIFLPQDS